TRRGGSNRSAVPPRHARRLRVRHDLPRTPLLLLVDRPRPLLPAERAGDRGSRTGRDPRRLTPAVRDRGRRTGAGGGRVTRGRAGMGRRYAVPVPRVRRPGGPDARRTPDSARPAEIGGPSGRRLRGFGEREYSAELLRYRRGNHR